MTTPPARILVVALRRLGDVLLVTPLIRSLKRAWPDAAIDALVFAGTEGILAGNPDLHAVVTMPPRPGALQTLALLRRLWRRYDLALSTQAGDRPTLFAWAAGRRSAGFVDPEKLAVHVKRRALDVAVPVAPMLHRVTEVLRLAQALGIVPVAQVVAPSSATRAPQNEGCAPMRWSMWRRNSATSNGPSKVGAPSRPALPPAAFASWRPADRRRASGIISTPSGRDGPRSSGSTARSPGPACSAAARRDGLCRPRHGGDASCGRDRRADRRALRPDRSAALGPLAGRRCRSALDAAGTIQRRGNVWLVQNPLPCLPCQQEGCLRRLDSHSQCLDELPVARCSRPWMRRWGVVMVPPGAAA